MSAAVDTLAVTKYANATCQRCGERYSYVYVRAPVPRAWCDDCRDPARREQKDAAKKRHRQRQAGELPPAEVPPVPPAPDWSRAFCQLAPAHMRGYWVSESPAEREAARHACKTRCEVEPECAIWSLALPVTDSAIYAGLSQHERNRRKRAARDEIARQALKGWQQ